MATHTPGPWARSAAGYGILIGSDSACVAVVYGPTSNLHSEANVNLFLAAPDLLLALKTMLNQVADDPRAMQFFDRRLIAMVKSTVEKAEGRL